MVAEKVSKLLVCLLLFSCCCRATPAVSLMAQLGDLLETQGSSYSGRTTVDGYFILVVGFSSSQDQYTAYEQARLEALRLLNDSVNGSVINGRAQSSIDYDGETDKVEQTFSEIIVNQFQGEIHAARVLKRGRYDDQYFVAMVLTQNDIRQVAELRSPTVVEHSVKSPTEEIEPIRANGVASIKKGLSTGRKMAIDDAIHNAVQQAKGVMVSGRSGMFNGMLSIALSSKTLGYVHSYDLVEEDQRQGSYFVTIAAKVDSRKLLKDVNFYLAAFNTPTFIVFAQEQQASSWLQPKLAELGFNLTTDPSVASHGFTISQHQSPAIDQGGSRGFKTRVVLTLKDIHSGELLFTLHNNENKTIYRLADQNSAKAASIQAAYKQLGKNMADEIVAALAKIAQQGRLYPITISNANRADLPLFRHALENGAEGTLKRWEWNENNKQLMLFYHYVGPFSEAVEHFLPPLYFNYKTQGKGRRAHAVVLASDHAIFRILQ